MLARSRLLALAAVALAATAVPGAAATLGVTGHQLGAGHAPVPSCDDDGQATVAYVYEGDPGSPVTGLAVSGLDSACNGGLLRATVTRTDGSGAVHGTTAVTVASGGATVTLASAVEAEDAQRTILVVVGP